MEATWSSLVIVVAIVAVCSAAAAVWRELETRHRKRRVDSLRTAPEAAPQAPHRVASDRITRDEVLQDAMERMTQPGALSSSVDVPLDVATPLSRTPAVVPAPRRTAARRDAIHAREWDETVPMVALSGVLPHGLSRDSVQAPPATSDHGR